MADWLDDPELYKAPKAPKASGEDWLDDPSLYKAEPEGFTDSVKRRLKEQSGKTFGQRLAEAPGDALASVESLARGVGGGLNRMGGMAALLAGMPVARGMDWIAEAGGQPTGFTIPVGEYVDESFREGDRLVREDPRAANPENQIMSALGGVIPDLASALLTRGESAAIAPVVQRTVREGVGRATEQMIEQGARASVLPSLTRGSELGLDVINEGGTISEALGAAGTGASANTLAFMVPGAASGRLPVRAVQGAVIEPAAGYLQQQAENMALPDRLGLDQAYDSRSAFMDVFLGGGLGGIMGDRPGEAFRNPDTMRGTPEDVASAEIETALDEETFANRPAPPIAPRQTLGEALAPEVVTEPPVAAQDADAPFRRPVEAPVVEENAPEVPPPLLTVEKEDTGSGKSKINYTTEQRSDGSHSLVREVVYEDGEVFTSYLGSDGSWKKGRPSRTAGGGGAFAANDFTPQSFESAEKALSEARDDAGVSDPVAAESTTPEPTTTETLYADYKPEENQTVTAKHGEISFPENRLTRRALDDAMEVAKADPVAGAERLLTNLTQQPDIRPEQKWLAEKLAPMMAPLGVKLVAPREDLPYAGAYSNTENTVWARQADPETILHETFHGVTSALITSKAARSNPVVGKAVAELDDMLGGLQSQLGMGDVNLASLHPEVQRLINDRQGPLSNTKEFVTYGLTNRPFQDFLRTLPPPPGRTQARNMWEFFKQAVTSLFGKMTPQQRTFLDALIETGADLTEFASANPSVVKLAQQTEAAKLTPPAQMEAAPPKREYEATLRDGTPVRVKITPPEKYSTGGRDHTLEVFGKDGSGLGSLSYGKQEVGGGTTSRAGPLVLVDEGNRRKGIATFMYEEARKDGGLFPPLDAENADRTEAGQALREGMARKGVSPDRPKEPPAAKPVAPAPKPETTSIKNKVIEDKRAEEGKEPIKSRYKADTELLGEGRDEQWRAPDLIEHLLTSENPSVSDKDSAVLQVYWNKLSKDRDAAADRASDPELTQAQRDTAAAEYDALSERAFRAQEAFRVAGTMSGRALAFRRRMLADEWTLEAMVRREQVVQGESLSKEQHAEVKKLHAKLEEANARAEAAEKAQANAEVAQVVAGIKERALRGGKKPSLESLRKKADTARKTLLSKDGLDAAVMVGNDPAALPPDLQALSDVGAFHYADGKTDRAAWDAAMRADVGKKFDDMLDAAWAEAKSVAEGEPKTSAAVLAAIGDNPTPRDVHELVLAHVREGVAPDKVIAKVASELKIPIEDAGKLFTDRQKAVNPTKDQDRQTVKELKEVMRLEDQIADADAGLPSIRNAAKKSSASAAIIAKRARLNELLKAQRTADPARKAAFERARIENLRKQIEMLDEQIMTGERMAKAASKPVSSEVARLTTLRDQLKKDRALIDSPPLTPEQRYQKSRATGIANELKKLQARIAAGDYAPQVRTVKQLSDENKKAQFELAKLKYDIAKKQWEHLQSKRSKPKKALDSVVNIAGLARSIFLSIDLGFTGLQMGMFTGGHPIKAARILRQAIKSGISEAELHANTERLKNRPNAEAQKRAGLPIIDDMEYKLGKMEEQYMTTLIDKLPSGLKGSAVGAAIGGLQGGPVGAVAGAVLGYKGKQLIKASNRAMVDALNQVRAQMFDAMYDTRGPGREFEKNELQKVGRAIGDLTGRAGGNKYAEAAGVLNGLLLAPRWMFSRFKTVLMAPLYGEGSTSRTRKHFAKEYARALAGWSALTTASFLAWMAFEDDEDKKETVDQKFKRFMQLDPLKSGFGDMQFGKLHVNATAGLGSVITFLARIGAGQYTTAKGESKPLRDNYTLEELPETSFTDKSMDAVFSDFAKGRLSPPASYLYSGLSGKSFDGPFDPVKDALKYFSPLTSQGLKDELEVSGVPFAVPLLIAKIFGGNVGVREASAFEPDYKNMSRDEKDVYSDFNEEVTKIKQSKQKLQDYANTLPPEMAPADMKYEVEKKASELGLEGATVDVYKRNTTARDDDGKLMRGVKRTESGAVKLNMKNAWSAKGISAAEKKVSEIDEDIEALEEADTNADVEAVWGKYAFSPLTDAGDGKPSEDDREGALKLLRLQRKLLQGETVKERRQ